MSYSHDTGKVVIVSSECFHLLAGQPVHLAALDLLILFMLPYRIKSKSELAFAYFMRFARLKCIIFNFIKYIFSTCLQVLVLSKSCTSCYFLSGCDSVFIPLPFRTERLIVDFTKDKIICIKKQISNGSSIKSTYRRQLVKFQFFHF